MKEFDFSLFTDRQLKYLAREVKLEYLRRRAEAKCLVKQRGGLLEGSGPLFQNPDNSAETWSGKGAQPAWVKAALATGKTLEDLRFSDDRPVVEARPGRSADA